MVSLNNIFHKKTLDYKQNIFRTFCTGYKSVVPQIVGVLDCPNLSSILKYFAISTSYLIVFVLLTKQLEI